MSTEDQNPRPTPPPVPQEGTPAGCLILTVTEGPHLGQTFSFTEHDAFFVGRSKRAHFQLRSKDRYFSRIHFMVEVNPPYCRLIDMVSRNGTFVNGQRVQMANLKDGDTIKAGHTVLTVSIPPSLDGPVPNHHQATVTFLEKPEVLRSDSLMEDSRVPESFPVIPGYEIVRLLGRGGMGTIYEAQRKSDKARLALKTIVPAVTGTPVLVQRFLREARILCLLNHPNIVSFRDMGESQGMLFFAMDFVEGTDAARMLKEKGPLPVRKAVRLITQVLAALVYAHQRGFVHRDIKPSNILVESSGRKKSVRVADFGLARIYLGSKLSGLTMQGEIGGTFAFMAPEQATHFRQTKPPADQYAAAATLYNLLTDRFLYDFTEGGVAALVVILTKETIPIEQRRPDLPPGLARVIGRATARRPEDRFPDVQAFRQELLPFGR